MYVRNIHVSEFSFLSKTTNSRYSDWIIEKIKLNQIVLYFLLCSFFIDINIPSIIPIGIDIYINVVMRR